MGADRLFSEAVNAEGVGLAVMNRLGRAAAFHIVHAEDVQITCLTAIVNSYFCYKI